jgi:hypothetical protein
MCLSIKHKPAILITENSNFGNEAQEVVLEEHKVKRGSQHLIGHGSRSNGNQEDDEMFNVITDRDDFSVSESRDF